MPDYRMLYPVSVGGSRPAIGLQIVNPKLASRKSGSADHQPILVPLEGKLFACPGGDGARQERHGQRKELATGRVHAVD
jgi:hypothetical protein